MYILPFTKNYIYLNILCAASIPYAIRLSGCSPDKGNVEVRYQGIWGYVCGYSWDIEDAEVVCRELGFEGVREYTRYSRFGYTYGKPYWLSYVNCSGNESSLIECPSMRWNNVSCSSYSAAGVWCKSKYNIVYTQIRFTMYIYMHALIPFLVIMSLMRMNKTIIIYTFYI